MSNVRVERDRIDSIVGRKLWGDGGTALGDASVYAKRVPRKTLAIPSDPNDRLIPASSERNWMASQGCGFFDTDDQLLNRFSRRIRSSTSWDFGNSTLLDLSVLCVDQGLSSITSAGDVAVFRIVDSSTSGTCSALNRIVGIPWLQSVYQLCAHQKIDEALRSIFRSVDAHLDANDFDSLNFALDQADLSRLTVGAQVAILRATFRAKLALIGWNRFLARVQDELRRREVPRLESLLSGLTADSQRASSPSSVRRSVFSSKANRASD